MTDAKSIYSIQVDDAGFKRFQTLFQKYQDQLAKVPQAWKDIAEAQGKTSSTDKLTKALDQMEGTIDKIGGSTSKISPGLEKADLSAQKFGRTMRSIGSVTADMAKTVAGLALGLAGFGAIGLGAPLWLVDRLGQSASNMAVTSGGINSRPGSVQAFNSSFARVGADTGMLSSLANAQQDAGMSARLGWLTGQSPGQVANADTTQLAIDVMRRERAMMKNVPRNMWGTYLGAYGFSQAGITPQMANLINGQSDSQFNSMTTSFGSQAASLNSDTSKGTMTAWQNFTQSMTEAGNKIEDVFIKGLAPLAQPLSDLSKAFSDAAVAFFKSGKLQQWITDFSNGLEVIAKSIGTKDFQTKITDFTDDVVTIVQGLGSLGKEIVKFTKWWTAQPDDVHNHIQPWSRFYHQESDSSGPSFGNNMITNASWNMGAPGGGNGRWGGLDASNGLPAGFLEAVEKTESNNNPYAVSKAGAAGAFQFMPDTASRFGLANPFDEQASAVAAGSYYNQLFGMFGGDTAKALAGYNWGEGKVQKAVSKYGANWLQHAPAETQQYVAKIMGQLQGGIGGTRIIIENNTGGSAVISTSMIQS